MPRSPSTCLISESFIRQRSEHRKLAGGIEGLLEGGPGSAGVPPAHLAEWWSRDTPLWPAGRQRSQIKRRRPVERGRCVSSGARSPTLNSAGAWLQLSQKVGEHRVEISDSRSDLRLGNR